MLLKLIVKSFTVRLSQNEFNRLLKSNKLAVSLIGMSNTGKSYWSEKFTELNFEPIHCDDLIEAKLASELKARGYSGIADVSRWMGQPYDKRFAANQQKYLDCERDVISETILKLKAENLGNVVIDTTGSFVHLENDICSQLQLCSLIVCIEATKDMQDKMFKLYIEKPKPVIFGDIFSVKKGETGRQALKRCYPELLDYRSRLYRQYADVVISRDAVADNLAVDKFVSLVSHALA